MNFLVAVIDGIARRLGRRGLERCGDPKCRGVLDRSGVCIACGYDW